MALFYFSARDLEETLLSFYMQLHLVFTFDIYTDYIIKNLIDEWRKK